MKFVFFALIMLSSFKICAEVIPNVFGISGRLESLTCRSGAFVMGLAEREKLFARAEATCKDSPEAEFEDCFESVVRKYVPASNVVFKGLAIEGKKPFQMKILSLNGKNIYFDSLREGLHADMNDGGISLMFNRLGVPDDEFMIESGRLSDDGKTVSSLLVPVKRRLLSDQLYFFFDCQLEWIY